MDGELKNYLDSMKEVS